METRIGCNDLLMEHSGTLTLTITSHRRESPWRMPFGSKELPSRLISWCFGTEHCAVYRSVEIPRAKIQAVGLAGHQVAELLFW